MYTKDNVEFLLDESDPVQVYEAKAPAQQSSQYDQGMEVLSQLDRVQQVEALHGKNFKVAYGYLKLNITSVQCIQTVTSQGN